MVMLLSTYLGKSELFDLMWALKFSYKTFLRPLVGGGIICQHINPRTLCKQNILLVLESNINIRIVEEDRAFASFAYKSIHYFNCICFLT